MPVKIKNRHRLKNKEIKDILTQIKTKFQGDFFDINSAVEIGDLEGFRVILVDGEVDFIMVENSVIFTLRGLYKYKPREYFVVVDMGAVGFVTKGADVMTPGIVDADVNIQKDDYVWICDETHRKPLAVGIALMTGEEMKNKSAGKAIKNIHHVGDKLWNLSDMVM
jgi:PUA domain protein